MKIVRFLVSVIVILAFFGMQVGAVFAAPEAVSGTVQSITLETNTNTAVTTVLVTLLDSEVTQSVRISIEVAIDLGLVTLGGDGNPVINEAILGQLIEVDSAVIIVNEQEKQHPVGDALTTFFSDIADLDYETIMSVHNEGTGFGVIAQALWLTRKLEGNSETFLAIINAKKTKDFSAFVLEDGTTPANWGQLKNAILGGKKERPSIELLKKENPGNGNNNGITNNDNGTDSKNKDKDTKDKEKKTKNKEDG